VYNGADSGTPHSENIGADTPPYALEVTGDTTTHWAPYITIVVYNTDGDSRKINTNTAIINTTISLFLPHCHIIVHLLEGAKYNWFLLCIILLEIKQ